MVVSCHCKNLANAQNTCPQLQALRQNGYLSITHPSHLSNMPTCSCISSLTFGDVLGSFGRSVRLGSLHRDPRSGFIVKICHAATSTKFELLHPEKSLILPSPKGGLCKNVWQVKHNEVFLA